MLEPKCANLKSLGHDAAHDGADPQRALHVQFAKGGFELVDGDQPGTDGGRGSAEQIQLPVKKQSATSFGEYLVVSLLFGMTVLNCGHMYGVIGAAVTKPGLCRVKE